MTIEKPKELTQKTLLIIKFGKVVGYKFNVKNESYVYMLAINNWKLEFEKPIPFTKISTN